MDLATPEGARDRAPSPATGADVLRVAWLGRVPYAQVAALQESLRDRVLAGDDGAERLLLLEHTPVITLGRAAQDGHVLASPELLAREGVELLRSSRGGDVTYHGPGQLVIYPVMRVPAGVRAFVETMGAEIVAELCARSVPAVWRSDPAGVWVGEAKIASCGLHVSHGVAIHGFALNVTCEPLRGFGLIVPCGLAGVRVTSIESERGAAPPVEELAAAMGTRIARAFGRRPVSCCEQGMGR